MRLFTTFFALLLSLSSAPLLAFGSMSNLVAEDHQFRIDPRQEWIEIDFETLIPDGSSGVTVELDQGPLHGTLEVLDEAFRFFPGEGLYSVHADRFTYTLSDASELPVTGTVFISLRRDDEVLGELDFEGGPEAGIEEPFLKIAPRAGSLLIRNESAMEGAFGLRTSLEPGDAEALLELDHDHLRFTHETGRVHVLGCDFGNLQQKVAILSAGPSHELGVADASVRVIVEVDPGIAGNRQARVEMKDSWGQWHTSLAMPIDSLIHHLDFDWWPSTFGKEDGGAILSIDGQAVLVDGVDTSFVDLTTAQIGLMPVDDDALQAMAVDYDQVTFYAEGITTGETALLVEDFESGTQDLWDQNQGSGVEIAKSWALGGAYALESTTFLENGYLVSTLPKSESSLNVRFTIDVTGATLTPGETLRLVDLGSGSNLIFGSPDASLRITSIGGVLHLGFYSLEPSGVVATAHSPVTGRHQVELQWMEAPGSGPSGYLRLRIDGAVAGELLHLESNAEAVDWLRLGIMGVSSHSTLPEPIYFDDFMAWR